MCACVRLCAMWCRRLRLTCPGTRRSEASRSAIAPLAGSHRVTIMLPTFRTLRFPRRHVRLALAILAFVLVSACSSPEDRAQSYYENGMKLLAANDYARAGVELRNAVRLKKN